MIDESIMMLAKNWDWHDVVGWYATEKLFDARAFWCGKSFWSRGGLKINAPDWLSDWLPNMHVDGGVVCGYGKQFEAAAIDAVTHGRFPEDARFCIYDFPNLEGNYFERMSAGYEIDGIQNGWQGNNLEIVQPVKITSNKHLAEMVRDVLDRGGEGLMLHAPKGGYLRGRTSEMLKLKWCPQEFLYS